MSRFSAESSLCFGGDARGAEGVAVASGVLDTERLLSPPPTVLNPSRARDNSAAYPWE